MQFSLFFPTTESCALEALYRILAIFTVAGGVIWGRTMIGGGTVGESLRKRYLTFAAIVAVMLVPALLGGVPFTFLIGALTACCIAEYFQMVQLSGAQPYKNAAMLLALFTILASVSSITVPVPFAATKQATSVPLFYLMPVITVFVAALLPVLRQKSGIAFSNLCFTIFGVNFFAWFLSHLLLIRALPEGFGCLTFFCMCVGLNDTAAFAFGKLLGKTKMTPVLSPAKTWEGFVGGAVGTIVAAAIFHNGMSGVSTTTVIWLTLSIIISAPLGDLILSAIKRECKVKDCGSLLPGHGGLLDRFDSWILGAPIFYYILAFSR